jgi:hypothetical protein
MMVPLYCTRAGGYIFPLEVPLTLHHAPIKAANHMGPLKIQLGRLDAYSHAPLFVLQQAKGPQSVR